MYSIKINHAFKPLPNDEALLELSTSDVEGFSDGKVFLVRELLTNLHDKAGYRFESIATPVAMVNYWPDSPETPGGVFRVDEVNLVFPDQGQAEVCLEKMEERVAMLRRHTNIIMDDSRLTSDSHTTSRGEIVLKRSPEGLPFSRLVVEGDEDRPLLIMKPTQAMTGAFHEVCPKGAEKNYTTEIGNAEGWLAHRVEMILETSLVDTVVDRLLQDF